MQREGGLAFTDMLRPANNDTAPWMALSAADYGRCCGIKYELTPVVCAVPVVPWGRVNYSAPIVVLTLRQEPVLSTGGVNRLSHTHCCIIHARETLRVYISITLWTWYC